jgi:hypothetical protein
MTPTTPTPGPVLPGWALPTAVVAAVLGVTGLILGPHGLGLVATITASALSVLVLRAITRAVRRHLAATKETP